MRPFVLRALGRIVPWNADDLRRGHPAASRFPSHFDLASPSKEALYATALE